MAGNHLLAVVLSDVKPAIVQNFCGVGAALVDNFV
jgi:hypothetical protein